MAVIYINRITGATNNLVYMVDDAAAAVVLAAGYIASQAANIAALNEGEWTWQANDIIFVSAADGVLIAAIDADFETLSLIAAENVPIPDSVENGITAAAGGGQTNARALTESLNRITTVATAGDSVKLPAAAPGLEITVVNNGANIMQVFGDGTDTINGVAAATGVPQLPNSVVRYVSAVAGLWQSQDVTGGYADGNLPKVMFANALTAHAGGTQAAALALTAMINNVTTVATAADSVRLPASAAGMVIWVANNGANAMQVYGAGTDTINGVATATGVSQAAGTLVAYVCAVAGNWVADVNALGIAGAFLNSVTTKNLLYGATPVAQVDPASCTITAAAGAANVATVTIQLKDGSGTNLARSMLFRVYASSAADGLTLASAASTGFSVASGGLSLNNGAAITTQITAMSSATGGCVLSLTDTAKQTSYLVLVLPNGNKISAQLTTGSYG